MSLIRGALLTYTHQAPLAGIDDNFAWWGGGSIGIVPVPLLITLALLILFASFLRWTRPGRDFCAIGGNREAAYLAGIAVLRCEFLAYVISGALAALAGVLLASRLNSATVQLGNDTALLSIAAALIGGASLLGGRGRISGAFLGLLALGIYDLNLDKRLFHMNGHERQLLKMQARYGSRIRIESFTDEHVFTLESIDPELPVDEIIRDFGLVEYGTFIHRCTDVQVAARSRVSAPVG